MMNIKQTRPVEVLLADDSDEDVELTRLGFQQSKLLVNLHRVADGVECLAFLRKQDVYSNVPTPDLLLLDLNMPRFGGREVLAEIEKDENLNSLPVVVLTTSEQDHEVLTMYKMGCNSYIVKPIDFDQFVKVIQGITEYWFELVLLPKVQSPDLLQT
jgi:two-component system, chemotaxis family, response regulator Rcp1